MTSPILAPIDRPRWAPRRRRARATGGFTLVEMLCVIGIILVLLGLLIPAINQFYGRAARTSARADLEAIAVALAAYKADFGDYPRVRIDPTLANTASTGFSDPQPNPMSGAQILCFALYGPAQAVDPAPGGKRPRQDGADGMGFRTRPGDKIWPAYLPNDRFRIGIDDELNNTNFATDLRMTILDRYNRSVCYFPANPTKPNIRFVSTTSYVGASSGTTETGALYDSGDNLAHWFGAITATQAIVTKKMRLFLGDDNNNGYIDGAEKPYEQDYLLWSVGPDEKWGPSHDLAAPTGLVDSGVELDYRDAAVCDDVTNFRNNF